MYKYPDDFINKIICGDCLKVISYIPDNSINLVIADPPYNIKKADWDKIPNYIEWLGNRIKGMERVLKDNGSFYLFHNDFLQMVEIQNWINQNSRFVFKSLITVDKLDNSYIKDKYGSQNHFRNYLNLAEYILFYTFQDETGLTTVMLDLNNFTSLRQYFKNYQIALGLTKKQIIEKIGQCADHCFRWNSSQWDLPTKETYELLDKIPLKYKFVRREYEDLRRKYEDLRYTFNKKDGLKNIWAYHFKKDKQYSHPTQKPYQLIKDIILNSSNENDLILDPFIGTGTTAVACQELNRNYIGIENKLEYVNIARKRVNATPEPLF